MKIADVATVNILPSGYTQLEYLRSDGECWIDIETMPNQNSKIEVDYQVEDITDVYSIFGITTQGDNNKSFFMRRNTAGTATYANFGSNPGTVVQQGPNDTLRHKTVLSKDGWYVDGVLCATFPSQSFSSGDYMYLFSMHYRSSQTDPKPMKGRIYGAKFWSGTTLLGNHVPCKRNSDGALGMYDTVYKVFEPKEGTGSFTAGPLAKGAVYMDLMTAVPSTNLFDKDQPAEEGWYYNDEGVRTSYNNTVSNTTNFLEVKPNTAYTVSGTNSFRFYFFDENKNWISRTTNINPAHTITTPANCHYMRFQYNNANAGATATNLDTTMLNEGSTALSYESYGLKKLNKKIADISEEGD